jgi:dolichyl-phosphate beta-glucosyltransferase
MPKTCVIIPCYNEEERLPTSEFIAFSQKHSEFEFLFVNDASTDKTESVINEMISSNPDSLHYLSLEKNHGKAEAIRSAVTSLLKEKDYDIIGFLDADLASPLNEALRMNAYFEDPKYQFVFGSRIQKVGSNVDRTLKRHIMGRLFATFASNILGIAVYDTQCGAKFFSSEAAEIAFKDPFVSRWYFDIEIFHRLHKHYGERFFEIAHELPVRVWKEVGGSKIKMSDVFKTPFELLKIKRSFKK